jgi:acetolactate synthase small subunit
LAVGLVEKRGVSRITLVIPGTDKSAEALTNH